MLLAILFASIVSCATPPDVPICTPLDDVSGYCFNTISETEYPVDDVNLFEDKSERDPKLRMKTWTQLRDVSLVIPPYSYAKVKAYIQANCKRDEDCSEDLYRWKKKIKKADQKMNSRREK